MHVNGDIGALEILQPSRVVEVQVAHDYHFHVANRVARECDLGVEIHRGVIVDAGEEVVDLGADDFRVVGSCTGFKEDEAVGGVGD